MFVGNTKPEGNLGLLVIKKEPPMDTNSIRSMYHYADPFARNLKPEAVLWRKKNYSRVIKQLTNLAVIKSIVKASNSQLVTAFGALQLTVIRKNDEIIHYGLAGTHKVTDNGVGFIVDGFQNIVELENMKYHGIGTGGTAEATADSALVTELTTQYSTDNTRATGTTIEGATANVYRTVGTNTVDASVALVEHGVFDQAATGGGVLLDRTVFTVINLDNLDSLQSTYDITFTAGG